MIRTLVCLLILCVWTVQAGFLEALCSDGNLCRNGGTCYPGERHNAWCKCPSGFYGSHCEYRCSCGNGGTCTAHGNHYKCECDYGFIGTRCEISEIPSRCVQAECGAHGVCAYNKHLQEHLCTCEEGYAAPYCTDRCPIGYCSNGGTCVKNGTGLSCLCPSNYQGIHCEKDVDECADQPCGRHGKCENLFGSFQCHCNFAYIGEYCEMENHHACSAFEEPKCQNGGFCQDDDTCVCPSMYTGSYCEQEVDMCVDSPCQNGATCMSEGGEYKCICTFGWEGDVCADNIDDCKGNPCGEGTCIDGLARHSCVCPEGKTGLNCELINICETEHPCKHGHCESGYEVQEYFCRCEHGFTGVNCTIDIDECAINSNLCYNNATCVNTPGSFECRCSQGYTGLQCESHVDYCSSNLCQNNGVCISEADSFSCYCMPGYSGSLCQIECPKSKTGPNCTQTINTCQDPTFHCLNGGFCSSSNKCVCPNGFYGDRCERKRWHVEAVCTASTCSNGGICQVVGGVARCRCPGGFIGSHCQHMDYSQCVPEYCQNNATCISRISGFECLCPTGFKGRKCEIDIDDCFPNPCSNDAKCIDKVDGYKCQCLPGFSGPQCQKNDDDCKEGLCLNGGVCIDGIDEYRCSCKRGFTGKNCQIAVDVDKFNNTDRIDRERCELAHCAARSGDGICDADCNFFSCSFDGGDCSAKNADPFGSCPAASYCYHVFGDGNCDPICNNPECLFDGLDCEKKRPRCPPKLKDYCKQHYADGICDEQCMTEGCGYDGGDCDKRGNDTLSDDMIIVVIGEPSEILVKVREFLISLSRRLRASVWIKKDSEGPMIYNWKDGNQGKRLIVGNMELLAVDHSVSLRRPRATSMSGVQMWVQADFSQCHGDVCFRDMSTVVNFIGAASAKQELSDLPLPIHQAMVHRPTPPDSESTNLFVIFAFICIGVAMVPGVLYVLDANRKRVRKESAVTWRIPTEAELKLHQHQQNLYLSFDDGEDHRPWKKRKEEKDDWYPRKQPLVRMPKIYPAPTALHEAAGFDLPISLPINRTIVNARTEGNRTPLHYAVNNELKSEQQICKDIEELQKAGADLNAQDENEDTPLLIAACRGLTEVVMKLLDLKADPNIINKKDSTCLHMAVKNCNIEMVERMLTNKEVCLGINLCDTNNRNALMLAAINDHVDVEMLEMLSKAGADIQADGVKNANFWNGKTALHYAAQYGNIKAVQWLLDANANKDALDKTERTPLFYAVSNGWLEVVKVLLNANVIIDIKDIDNRSALEIATWEKQSEIEKELLEALDKVQSLSVPMEPEKVSKKIVKKPAQANSRKRKPLSLTPPRSDGSGTSSPPLQESLLKDSIRVECVDVHEGTTNLAFSPTEQNGNYKVPNMPQWNQFTPSPPYEHDPPYYCHNMQQPQSYIEYGGGNSGYPAPQVQYLSYNNRPQQNYPPCQYSGHPV